MQAPPLVRRRLRAAGRGVLPLLLAAQGREVEEGPDAAQRLDPAPPRLVGEEDAVAVAQEDVAARSTRSSRSAFWNSSPTTVYQGIAQPIRSLERRDLRPAARVETSANVTSRALRCASSETWSVNIEQPPHGSPSAREPEVVERSAAGGPRTGRRSVTTPVGPLELVVGPRTPSSAGAGARRRGRRAPACASFSLASSASWARCHSSRLTICGSSMAGTVTELVPSRNLATLATSCSEPTSRRWRCSIARSLAVAGEPWSPLVIRDVFVGINRFDDLQRDLGISRKVLAERLQAPGRRRDARAPPLLRAPAAPRVRADRRWARSSSTC